MLIVFPLLFLGACAHNHTDPKPGETQYIIVPNGDPYSTSPRPATRGPVAPPKPKLTTHAPKPTTSPTKPSPTPRPSKSREEVVSPSLEGASS